MHSFLREYFYHAHGKLQENKFYPTSELLENDPPPIRQLGQENFSKFCSHKEIGASFNDDIEES